MDNRIAIIGMSGRFPASDNVAEFWDRLRRGRTGIKDVTPNPGSKLPQDPNYVPKAATVEQADCFDCGFFGILPKMAQEMDPQHRLFLEASWSALEDAGYRPDRTPNRVGIFAGSHMNTYIFLRLAADQTLRESLADSFPGGNLNAEILNDKDYLATRTAFHLNLRGPAVAVQSACSTSLVAIAQACESLRSGACQMALAGGVCITFPQDQGYLHTEDSIISPDGFCRTFDAEAKGTVFGDGVGVVVLKRLADAIADRDPIYATIRGWGVNNDGNDKAGYTAPSVSGQVNAILQAHRSAGISADSISYVEAHGTGTLVGDPIEIAALTEAFRTTTQRTQFCAIGSLKSNFGHLDVAAGVAATIKVALALKHRQLPPSLHFKTPNPNIDFANSPFFVQTQLSDWPAADRSAENGLRKAGISSFGVGGTNAHLVLEEYVEDEIDRATGGSKGTTPAESESPVPNTELVCLSARNPDALDRMRQALAAHLQLNPGLNLTDIAYTLAVARKPQPVRCAITAGDQNSLIQQLLHQKAASRCTPSKLLFVFPGQGSQHVGMAANLYSREPQFARHLDEAVTALLPHVGLDLRELIFADSSRSTIDQTEYAQPAIFAVSYAVASWLTERGLRPDFVLGHSVGEFAAATICGIMSLQTGAKLIATRGRLMQQLPSGSMMAINIDLNSLLPKLPTGIEVAAMNAPLLQVVAGATDDINEFAIAIEGGLLGEDVDCRLLRTSHAFHTAMMDAAIDPFAQIIEQCELNSPKTPMISSVTGELLSTVDATSSRYWAEQIRRPVAFSRAVEYALNTKGVCCLETGPSQALTTLIKQHRLQVATQTSIPMFPHAKQQTCDHQFALSAIGQAWTAGVDIDFATFYANRSCKTRINLPGYSFDRSRQWFDVKPTSHVMADNRIETASSPSDASVSNSSHAKSSPTPNAEIQESSFAIGLVRSQMALMQKQLELLHGKRIS